MTKIAELAARAPRRKRSVHTEPYEIPCSMCVTGHPECVGCGGSGTVTMHPSGTRESQAWRNIAAAQPEKPNAPRMLPVRPSDTTDIAFHALIDLGWVAFAPWDDPIHSQPRML